MDVDYYCNELNDQFKDVDDLVAKSRKKKPQEREEISYQISSALDKARTTLKNLEVEYRSMDAGPKKREINQKVQEYKEKIETMKSTVNSMRTGKSDKEDLLGPTGGQEENSGEYNPNKMNSKQMMERGKAVQEQSLASVDNSLKLVDEMEKIGVSTSATLVKQGEQLDAINSDLDKLDNEIKRAGKELATFARRIMTDRCFLLLLFILICVVVAIIIYKLVVPTVQKDTGSDGSVISASYGTVWGMAILLIAALWM